MTDETLPKCFWFSVRVDSPRGVITRRRISATSAARAAAAIRKDVESLGAEILRLYGADKMMTVTVTAE